MKQIKLGKLILNCIALTGVLRKKNVIHISALNEFNESFLAALPKPFIELYLELMKKLRLLLKKFEAGELRDQFMTLFLIKV
jgi:hypothetical protein